jgi:activator of HSP90 ATPase
MTLVLPIASDEIYMTLLDMECQTILTGWEMSMDKEVGGVYGSASGELTGKVVSLLPTERIVLDLRQPHFPEGHWINMNIFLEEIDDGTRIFFHSSDVPASELEGWRTLWKEHFIEPLGLFFEDEG